MSTTTASSKFVWAGWILSMIPALMLLSGGIYAATRSPMVLQGAAHLGYPASFVLVMGTLEVLCIVLYLIPRTAFYGAILLTGYFGGATASHLRIGESMFFVPILFGVIVWAGLVLRDARLRALL